MFTFSINLTTEEVRILRSDIVSISEWIENMVHHKLRKLGDSIVIENTEYQPKKITKAKKDDLIKNVVLPIATPEGLVDP